MARSERSRDQQEGVPEREEDTLSEAELDAQRAREIEADLAALLDDEVIAVETGGPAPATSNTEDAATESDVAETPTDTGADAVVEAVDDGANNVVVDAAAPPMREPEIPQPSIEPPATPPASETIDVPPTVEDAQAVPPAPEASANVETDPLNTKRFGAIIMDSGSETVGSENAEAGSGGPASMIASRQVIPAGPGGGVAEERPLPVVERSDDQKAIIINRLTESLGVDWQRALHEQIDELYKQVATEFSSPPEKTERALSMLREARQTLLETPEEYVLAEYRTLQVRAMLDRTIESRAQSRVLGPRILGYQMGWLVLFLLGLIFATPLAGWVG
jgi:hypothetical protein